MSDSVLLLTGIAVFSLMLVGVVLTVLEFKQLRKQSLPSNRGKTAPTVSRPHGPGAGPKGD
jgi:hypothetical protein